MANKKSNRPHGHYCKICGEYKANEKFSGKGHAAHICKKCSQLSAADKAEAMTINRLYNLPFGGLSKNDRTWLENRVHDKREKVAELAKEVYNEHFPYAERNAKKKQLVISTLVFELHMEVFDEYGDEYMCNKRFTVDRHSRTLRMLDFDTGNGEQTLTLPSGEISKLLRWAVHSLEIFMWDEDYRHRLMPRYDDPFLDLLPEYYPELDDDYIDDDTEPEGTDMAVEPEGTESWKVWIEYADGTDQEIVSYEDYLPDRPEELYLALGDYFAPDFEDFEENEDEETYPMD